MSGRWQKIGGREGGRDMGKQDNVTADILRNWPYKLEKKGKALDQVEGPGRNAISAPSSSQYGDE
jgi:hypothetical protein